EPPESDEEGGGHTPALTPVFTFSPFAIVWLCCKLIPPAFRFVLIFIEFFLSLRLIAAGCRLPIQAKKECEIAGRGKRFWDLRKNIFHLAMDSPSRYRICR